MVNRKHSIARWVALFAVLGSFGGCQPNHDQPEAIDTVDVEPALAITPDDDPKAVQKAPELVGILPKDFPADLPLHLPASLVDFGTREGLRYVSLLTSSSLSRVDRELAARLRQKGWSITESSGIKRLTKGTQTTRLRLENARPGTLYHYEY